MAIETGEPTGIPDMVEMIFSTVTTF